MMSQDRFTIRPYRPDDEASVVALWSACGLVVPQNDPKRDIERKLRVNPDWFLVGDIAGEVVATCIVGYEGHRGWINYLAVAPAHQRRGLATQLVREAERRLRQVGCPKINLQVRAANTAVIDFYKALGFLADDVVSLGKRLEPDQP
jgi:ribosomal protein S18 acetylase RimI-like enzyme